MRLSADDVLSLARAYAECVGISLTTVGVRAAGNDKMFVRLATGRTCTVRSLERAARWFGCNWPVGLDWPEDIPRPEAAAGCSERAA